MQLGEESDQPEAHHTVEQRSDCARPIVHGEVERFRDGSRCGVKGSVVDEGEVINGCDKEDAAEEAEGCDDVARSEAHCCDRSSGWIRVLREDEEGGMRCDTIRYDTKIGSSLMCSAIVDASGGLGPVAASSSPVSRAQTRRRRRRRRRLSVRRRRFFLASQPRGDEGSK